MAEIVFELVLSVLTGMYAAPAPAGPPAPVQSPAPQPATPSCFPHYGPAPTTAATGPYGTGNPYGTAPTYGAPLPPTYAPPPPSDRFTVPAAPPPSMPYQPNLDRLGPAAVLPAPSWVSPYQPQPLPPLPPGPLPGVPTWRPGGPSPYGVAPMSPPPMPAPPTITRLPDTPSELRPSCVARRAATRKGAAERILDQPAPGPDHVSIAWQKRIVHHLNNAPAAEIAQAIERFYAGEGVVRVVAEPVSNSLLISALPNLLDEVVEHVEKLDRQPVVVAVEVCIAKITKTASTAPAKTATANKGDSHLCLPGVSLSSENIDSQLRELEKQGRLEILGRPKLMTLENQPAHLHVGQRVPILSDLDGNSEKKGRTIAWQNVGVVLGILPRVGDDHTITMEIDIEKSDVGPIAAGLPVATLPNGQVLRAPVINSTSVQTTIRVASGKTLTAAMLAEETTANGRVEHMEMVILISPRIASADTAARGKK